MRRQASGDGAEWDGLVGPFTSSDGVQVRLGVTRETVDAMTRDRRLLRVVSADGIDLYPLSQFDGNHILPSLPRVLGLFPEDMDSWTVAGWFHSPDAELGEPPLDALRHGEEARVLAVARTAVRSLGS